MQTNTPIDEAAFWQKLGRLGRKLPFADHLLAAFYAATDPATPARVKLTLAGAIAYFILPFDVLPDLLAGLGFTDDAAVLFAAIRAVAAHITPDHRAKAKAWLERTEG